MNITDINGATILIGKSSITVKDENGKTCGVVTNCKTAATFAPRDKFDLSKRGFAPDEIKQVVIHNGEVYFFNNKRLEKWIEKQKHSEFFKAEHTEIEKQNATAERMLQNGITVINCIY